PHGCGNELRSDDKRVAAMSAMNQIRKRSDGGGALAGAERRDQDRGVALIEPCRCPLRAAVQTRNGERRVLGGWLSPFLTVPCRYSGHGLLGERAQQRDPYAALCGIRHIQPRHLI